MQKNEIVIPAQAGIPRRKRWNSAFAGVALFFLCMLAAQPLFAADATVQKVETYLNGITTMQAHFAQANIDGSVHGGTFYLKRPGRLRFQYDAPKGDYIVADGLLIHYWDNDSKDYSNAPIGSTLADFLLRKNIKLTGELKVTDIMRPTDNKLVLTLVQVENPDAGDLKLMFRENPLQLQKWRVSEANGQMTEVTLTDIQTSLRVDPKLFVFKPPKGYDQDWQGRTR